LSVSAAAGDGVSREQAAHTARMARHVAVFRSEERFGFGVMQLSQCVIAAGAVYRGSDEVRYPSPR
jgi:hypothetical protein